MRACQPGVSLEFIVEFDFYSLLNLPIYWHHPWLYRNVERNVVKDESVIHRRQAEFDFSGRTTLWGSEELFQGAPARHHHVSGTDAQSAAAG